MWLTALSQHALPALTPLPAAPPGGKRSCKNNCPQAHQGCSAHAHSQRPSVTTGHYLALPSLQTSYRQDGHPAQSLLPSRGGTERMAGKENEIQSAHTHARYSLSDNLLPSLPCKHGALFTSPPSFNCFSDSQSSPFFGSGSTGMPLCRHIQPAFARITLCTDVHSLGYSNQGSSARGGSKPTNNPVGPASPGNPKQAYLFRRQRRLSHQSPQPTLTHLFRLRNCVWCFSFDFCLFTARRLWLLNIFPLLLLPDRAC